MNHGGEPMAESGHKGISRIGEAQKGGWFTRVYYRKSTYSKLFSDSIHGSKEMALLKAIQWRDKLKTELEFKYSDIPYERKARSNTGIVGVTKTIKNGRPCFSVSWQEEKSKQRCKTFSIQKHGESKALKLAQEWRMETMGY